MHKPVLFGLDWLILFWPNDFLTLPVLLSLYQLYLHYHFSKLKSVPDMTISQARTIDFSTLSISLGQFLDTACVHICHRVISIH